MKINNIVTYKGAGGKKPRTPITTNDNIFSRDRVELLLGVGEGEIFGLENGEKSFFVGDVPLKDAAGADVFQDFTATPHNGSSSPISITFALGGEAHSTDVGVAVTQKSPVIRYTPANMRGRFSKIDVRINIAQLYAENVDGDVLNNTAKFRVEWKATSSPTWNIVGVMPSILGLDPAVTLTIAAQADTLNGYQLHGKTSSGFVLDFSFTVPVSDTDDYALRVTKFNPDTDPTVTLRTPAEIVFDSFQLIGQNTRIFSNTAMVHITGRASDQFSTIPDFHGIYKGLITKIPNNYDPEALGVSIAYVEPWNGGLTLGWHTNPAWVLYDLLTNQRYGLAKYAAEMSVNLQDFYEAGKWCDELVQNQLGTGVEKRYTMNITVAENQTAWDYLQNIAGSFDGVIFDDGEGNVRLKVDRWTDPRVLFTPETINPEGFSYSFTDLTTRYNQITVSFNNKDRGWEQSRRKIPTDTQLPTDPYYLENGLVPFDMVAVGCITESEALRRAKARILTSNNETTIVSFTTTRLGLVLDPLEIVYISDPTMGWGVTGRVESISGNVIQLRDEITVASYPTYTKMYIQTETGVGYHTDVVLQSPKQLLVVGDLSFLNDNHPENAQFSLALYELGQKEPKPFRITSIEPLDGYDLFRITALEVYKAKYGVVGSDLDRVITINADAFDLNLRKWFLDQGNPQKLYSSVTFIIDGLVEQAQGSYLMVCASAVDRLAFKVGDWTGLLGVGVKPKVIIKGAVYIYGRGGKGGDGGFAYATAGFFADVLLGYGLSGQDGGDACLLDYPVDIEVEAGGNLRIFGGFGGGFGGRGAALTDFISSSLSYPVTNGEAIGRMSPKSVMSPYRLALLAGAGGSGGAPFGAAGLSGKDTAPATNILKNSLTPPAGTAGTKDLSGTTSTTAQTYIGGIRPRSSGGGLQVDPLVNYSIRNGEGQCGQPLTDYRNPQAVKVSPASVDLHTTSASSPTNGNQGEGVINRGNLTITVAPTAQAHLHSDLYGLENF